MPLRPAGASMAVMPSARADAPTRRSFSRAAATSALALALIWLALVTFGRVEEVPAAVAIDEAIVLDVTLRPAGHPPAALVVVQAPPGSRHGPGSVLGSVPSRVVVDRSGEWRFEAQFARRRSGAVAIVVPDQRAVTLDFSVRSASIP